MAAAGALMQHEGVAARRRARPARRVGARRVPRVAEHEIVVVAEKDGAQRAGRQALRREELPARRGQRAIQSLAQVGHASAAALHVARMAARRRLA